MLDVAVLGAGPCGLAAALGSARMGRRVLLIEKRLPFDARPESERRFQAVVVDEATLNNLTWLGMDVHDGSVHELREARFMTTGSSEQERVQYHPMATSLDGQPCEDLSQIGFRRKIVALTSIRELEDRLWRLVEAEPLISCAFDERVRAIDCYPDHVRLHLADGVCQAARFLAVCDGANSHQRGGLQLLGIEKRLLAEPIEIVAARYRAQNRQGELMLREAATEAHRHTACFGLPGELVVYTDVPEHLDASRLPVARGHMADLAPKLGVGELIGEPLHIRQQATIAERFRKNTVFVLGDAAFSGTAVLGVYLNKAICDAVTFARQLQRGGRRVNEDRARATYRQLITEEQFVSFVYNFRWPVEPPALIRDLIEAMPRSLFRLKSGRFGIPRSVARNYTDLASVYFQSLGQNLKNPSPVVSQNLLLGSRLFRSMGEVLEPTTPLSVGAGAAERLSS